MSGVIGGTGSGDSGDGGGQRSTTPKDFFESGSAAAIIEETLRKLKGQLKQNRDSQMDKTLKENEGLKEMVRNLEAEVNGVTLMNGHLLRQLKAEVDKVKSMTVVCRTIKEQLELIPRILEGSLSALMRFADVDEEETLDFSGGPSDAATGFSEVTLIPVIEVPVASLIIVTPPSSIMTNAEDEVMTSAEDEVMTNAEDEVMTNAEDEAMTNAEDEVMTNAEDEVMTNAEDEVMTNAEDEAPSTAGNQLSTAVGSEATAIPENAVTLITAQEEVLESLDNAEEQNATTMSMDPSSIYATYDATPVVTLGTIKEENCDDEGSSPSPPTSLIEFMRELDLHVSGGPSTRKYHKRRWPRRVLLGLRAKPAMRTQPNNSRSTPKRPLQTRRTPGRRCNPRHGTRDEDVLLYHRMAETKATSGCYCCCGQSFTTKVLLSQHIRNQNGDDKFVCLDCKKSFFLVGNLASHMKVHEKKKPLLGASRSAEFDETFTSREETCCHRKESG